MNMNKRKHIHPRKKQKILERDNFKCVNCGASGDFNCLEVDHIIPVINGGDNNPSNLQTLCYKCNMAKRFKKDSSKKYFLDLNPIERLELVKERLKLYKNLTYAEFKVVFTQDELFQRLRLDLLYLNDLFLEVSGRDKTELNQSKKNINQRDIAIYLLKKTSNMTSRKMRGMFKKYNFDISYQQISKIYKIFYDKENEKDKIERELIVSDDKSAENA